MSAPVGLEALADTVLAAGGCTCICSAPPSDSSSESGREVSRDCGKPVNRPQWWEWTVIIIAQRYLKYNEVFNYCVKNSLAIYCSGRREGHMGWNPSLAVAAMGAVAAERAAILRAKLGASSSSLSRS